MKTQATILLPGISNEDLRNLTTVTKETLAAHKKYSTSFTYAEMLNIQKQRRVFSSHRGILM